MGVLVYRYIGVPVCFCTGVPVYWYTSVLVYQGISVPDVLVYRVFVSRGIDVSDQRLKDANLRSSSSRKAGDPPFEVRDNFLIPELDSGASGHSRIHNFAFQGGGVKSHNWCTGIPVYRCSTRVLVYR